MNTRTPLTIFYRSLLLFSILFTASCLGTEDDPDLPDIVTTARADQRISILVQAWEKTGFIDNMINNIDYTILAPSNDAFETWLSEEGYADLDSIPLVTLTNLVDYHTQFGYALVENIGSDYYITPSLGGYASTNLSILAEQLSGGLTFNGGPKVVVSNIKAKNGLIHILDGVITMPKITDFLAANEQFSQVNQALEIANLDDMLRDGAPFTFFAPTNGAFEAYFSESDEYQDLTDIPSDTLNRWMRYHLLSDNIRSDSIIGTHTTLLTGKNLVVEPLFSGGYGINNSASILLNDVQAVNGVIHFTDNLLLLP